MAYETHESSPDHIHSAEAGSSAELVRDLRQAVIDTSKAYRDRIQKEIDDARAEAPAERLDSKTFSFLAKKIMLASSFEERLVGMAQEPQDFLPAADAVHAEMLQKYDPDKLPSEGSHYTEAEVEEFQQSIDELRLLVRSNLGSQVY